MKNLKTTRGPRHPARTLLLCGLLLSAAALRAAEPVAFSNEALIEPALADFGALSEDATYVFFLNGLKGGGSTAVAGDDAFGLKLEQWQDTGMIGVTEFGVADNVFDADGSGEPDSVFGEDVHLAFVNDFMLGEVRLYVDGELSGYYLGNFELAGEVKLMAARLATDGDAMGEGSILYSWAVYDEALSGEEIRVLAATAEPTEPPEPTDPPEPEDPYLVVSSSSYAPVTPTLVDFGSLDGDTTHTFFFKVSKGGASTALAGNDTMAIKLEQWEDSGVFGLTVFGVEDYVFEPVDGASVASVFDQDAHVAVVNDTSLGESRLYLDGILSGVAPVNFSLAGPGKVLAARLAEDTDPAGPGSILYHWAAYNAVLPDAMIAELAAAAEPFDPTGPFTEPTIVDLGPVEGDASYEFFFQAVKAGASTAIAGNDAWGLKLEQWPDTTLFGMTEFGVADHVFELEGDGDDASLFEEDAHVVFVNDVTNGEVRLFVNGVYVGYVLDNFELSGPTKMMAARLEQNTDPMGDGSVFYFWAVHPSLLEESEVMALYNAAEPREPAEPTDPGGPVDPGFPPVPEGALTEPTLVDFGPETGDATYEFAFHAFKAGASTAIAGNDAWGLKLDQWNEQGVFGITEFGVADLVFDADGPGDTASVFGEDVHVVFVNNVSEGVVNLYVNGLRAGIIKGNFDLSGEGKVMAARIEQEADPMGEGSVLYLWEVHEGILSDEAIADLAAAFAPAAGGVTSITQTGDGTITLEFNGVLESSDRVDGPYVPVDGATSPLTVSPSEGALFYIAR